MMRGMWKIIMPAVVYRLAMEAAQYNRSTDQVSKPKTKADHDPTDKPGSE